ALLTPKLMDTAINSTKQLFKELSGYRQSLGMQIITGERTYTIASYYNTQSIIKSELAGALVKDGNKFVNAGVKFGNDIMFF
ncbi:27058_t:CDS:2, partial [Racocetra persica]